MAQQFKFLFKEFFRSVKTATPIITVGFLGLAELLFIIGTVYYGSFEKNFEKAYEGFSAYLLMFSFRVIAEKLIGIK